MKTKLLFPLFFIYAFSLAVFAQTVTVTPKKITYTRPKPISEYKKTFTVTYPKVKAATPALSKKIERTISYQTVSSLNIEEEKNDVQWLEDASYEVGYNKNGVLTITLSVEGSGAYPSTYFKTVVVDLKTGSRVTPQAAFTNPAGLAAKAKSAQRTEIENAIAEIKADSENKDFDSFEDFERADFTIENLKEFSVDDKGVTFIYDYGFPHIIQALQPEGKYFFSWTELKPFIKRDGLLAVFVR